ncbi:MAG: sulfotransferase [Bacteroidota bacterium]|nr:sulfotransferase [Bacteroidota bacterium]
MKMAYLLAGMRLPGFLKLIRKNGMSIAPKYLARFLFLFQNGIWASIFHKKEKKLFAQKIKQQQLPDDPVIIVGHWRTGSTFLHQLLNLDKQFVTSNLFQGSIPDSFLTSRKSYEPIMSRVLKGTRPMDQVKVGLDEPLEDEYALFRLSGYSPLENLIFPTSDQYFLKLYPSFLPEGERLEQWKNALIHFYKKLTLGNQKTILIKNPFHSLRINLLDEIFPKARYIHIIRHPYKVVPSTVRMWNIVGTQNAMNHKWKKPKTKDVTEVLAEIETKIENDTKFLPKNRYCLIKFEDLENDPIKLVQSIYDDLNLNFSDDYKNSLIRFLSSVKDYKKNTYTLPKDDKDIIDKIMETWMKENGYNL